MNKIYEATGNADLNAAIRQASEGMTIRQKFESMIKAAVSTARMMISESKSADVMTPMWMALTGDNTIAMIATPYYDDSDKDAIAEHLRKLFEEKQVVAYIHISEVWRKSYPKDTPREEMQAPSECPDREEVVMFYCECVGEGQLIFYAGLTHKNGKKQFGDVVKSDVKATEGRFTNMLPERKLH